MHEIDQAVKDYIEQRIRPLEIRLGHLGRERVKQSFQRYEYKPMQTHEEAVFEGKLK